MTEFGWRVRSWIRGKILRRPLASPEAVLSIIVEAHTKGLRKDIREHNELYRKVREQERQLGLGKGENP